MCVCADLRGERKHVSLTPRHHTPPTHHTPTRTQRRGRGRRRKQSYNSILLADRTYHNPHALEGMAAAYGLLDDARRQHRWVWVCTCYMIMLTHIHLPMHPPVHKPTHTQTHTPKPKSGFLLPDPPLRLADRPFYCEEIRDLQNRSVSLCLCVRLNFHLNVCVCLCYAQ